MTDVPPPPPPPPPTFGSPPPGSSPDIGAALSYGWNKFTQNVGPLILAVIAPAVVFFIGYILALILLRASLFLFLVILFITILFAIVASIFVYRIALMITAGEPAEISKAFEYDRWGEWVIFAVAYAAIIGGLAVITCGLLGFVAAILFGLAPFYFIDQNMGIGDALKASWEATTKRAYWLPVLVALLVGGLGGIVCGIGALVTQPLAIVAMAFLYRGANNQPVAP